jgi:Ni/Co efflux regulator RcnB
MKRLILTTAMAALMAGAPIAAAWALDNDRGRGRQEQRGGGDRGGPGPRWERPGNRGERRFERPPPQRLRPDRRFDAPRALRPGGRLPGAYRDERVEDYGRYRLRPPPQGYAWYRTGDGFMLVSPDGQIFDVIVD